ncbi:MAG TPA: glutaredoxin family protein [Polyangia bacterium]|nr:glutaredoxin family protein [Polyangia bacterium]
MARLTLYTRVHCHLCDDAKAALERVRARAGFELDVIDVDTDAELQALYGLEVPVVLVDGKKWAKFRVDESALERRLRGGAA